MGLDVSVYSHTSEINTEKRLHLSTHFAI
jgi:hypothetical protein